MIIALLWYRSSILLYYGAESLDSRFFSLLTITATGPILKLMTHRGFAAPLVLVGILLLLVVAGGVYYAGS